MAYLTVSPRTGYNPAFTPDVIFDPVYSQEIITSDLMIPDPPPPGINSEADYNPIIDPIAPDIKNQTDSPWIKSDSNVIMNSNGSVATPEGDKVVTSPINTQPESKLNWLWLIILAIVAYFLYKKYE